MKEFLKKGQISLKNGGYLLNEKEEPVSNEDFVFAQKHAEYIVTFTEKAKGKTFTDKKADSIDDIKREVLASINSKNKVTYVETPAKPKKDLTEKLKKEALNFIEFEEGVSKIEKINKFLTNFDVINEYETYGLFFDQDIVKLNKIYTMEEVIHAVQNVIELID